MFQRRISITVLIGFMVLVIALSGCTSSNNGNNAENEQPSGIDISDNKSTGENDPTAEGGMDRKLTLSLASVLLAPPAEDAEMIRHWNEHFNVDLNVWNIERSQWDEVLNLRFAAGEIPDMMMVRGMQNLSKYYDQNLLAEIPEDLLKKYAPNLYAKTEEFQKGAFGYAKIDGKLYGIPRLNGHNVYRSATVYRGDWLNQVGMDGFPESLDEFEEAMYKFALEDPDGNGTKDTYGLSTSGLNAVYGAYGFIPDFWTERDGKLVYGAVQPEMKQALALLSQWYKDGVIDPEFITGENQGGNGNITHAFVNGKIGFTSHGLYYHWKPLLYEGDSASENYLELKKVNPAAADSLVYGVAPAGPDGIRGVIQGNMLSGDFVGFGVHLEDEPEKMIRLLQMLEYMNGDFETFMTSFFGMKGKHWDFNDANVPVLINGMKTNQLSEIGAHQVVNPIELPNNLLQRSGPRIEWADKNHWREGGIQNQLLGVLPSAGQYQVELDKIREEAYLSIITGDQPIDYFDRFVENWINSGGEKLVQEANEWFASNR